MVGGASAGCLQLPGYWIGVSTEVLGIQRPPPSGLNLTLNKPQWLQKPESFLRGCVSAAWPPPKRCTAEARRHEGARKVHKLKNQIR